MDNIIRVSADYPEVHKDNIGEFLDLHMSRWNQEKGGAWWVEDFMGFYGIWWTDFRQDLKKLLSSITPNKLNDKDELKKFMLAYIKPKMLKPGDKPKNTPDLPSAVSPHTKVAASNDEIKELISKSSSKNEAMSKLRQMGFINKQIADFMHLKPGRVSSGIRAYDAKEQPRKAEHDLW